MAPKSLWDASRFIVENRLKVEENVLTKYIQSAIRLLEKQGKDICDYALVKVESPMELAENASKVIIRYQWRLVHINKLVNAPQHSDD